MKPQRLLQKEDWITMPMQDAADTVTRRADAAATAPQAAAVTVPPAAEITQITRGGCGGHGGGSGCGGGCHN